MRQNPDASKTHPALVPVPPSRLHLACYTPSFSARSSARSLKRPLSSPRHLGRDASDEVQDKEGVGVVPPNRLEVRDRFPEDVVETRKEAEDHVGDESNVDHEPQDLCMF